MQKLKMVVIAVMSALTLSVHAAFTAKSYVQDGLVGLWDAEENAGWDTHEAAPEAWKNLVGGSVPDFTLDAAGVFEDKAFMKVQAGLMAHSDVVVTDARFKTVEVVMSDIPASGWAVGLYATNRQLIAVNDGTTAGKRTVHTCYWQSSGLESPNKPKVTSISVFFETNASGTLVAKGTRQGGLDGERVNNGPEPRTGCTLSVGGVTGSDGYGYNSTKGYRIHSIRLYDRQLTEAERQKNLRVDHARFDAAIYALKDTDVEWTGAAEDGKFSNGANWKDGFAPVAGAEYQKMTIASDGAAVIENDVGAIAAKCLCVCQVSDATKAVTIKGGSFALTSAEAGGWNTVKDNCALVNDCPLTMDADLTFTGKDSTFRSAKDAVCNGSVTVQATSTFCLYSTSSAKHTFNGVLSAPDAQVKTHGGHQDDFYGSVTARILTPGTGSAGETFNVYGTANDWTAKPEFYGGMIAQNADVLPSGFVFEWQKNAGKDSTGGDVGNHRYTLRGDQTCDRIESDAVISTAGTIRERNRICSDKVDVTLTLKGTANATHYGHLESQGAKKLNIVWDPTGNFTQTVADIRQSMIGEIVVKGGTFASAGTNGFPNVTAVRVGDGATFAVTASAYNGATNPFADKTDLWISGTGKVSVPAGVTMTVKSAYVKGVLLPVGTYRTGEEGCAWMTGGGAVQVLTCDGTSWKDASVSGRWNDEANWSNGLPDPSKPVYLSAEGEDYVVTLATGDVWPKDLVIRGANTTLKVPTGAAIAYDGDGVTSSIRVEDGAALLVDGGSLVITNFTGTFAVGSTVAVSSRVAVASGSFAYAPKAQGSPMTFNAGGLADVSGGELRMIKNYTTWSSNEPFVLAGGNLSVCGDGYLNLAYSSGAYLQMPGEMRFSGDARVAMTPSWRDEPKGGNDNDVVMCPNVGDTLTWTIEDHASLAADNTICLGRNGGRSILNFSSDAQQWMPYNVMVGYANGFGELNISDGIFEGRNGLPRGLCVGMSSTDQAASFASAEGIFNLSGGAMTICRDGITGWGQDKRILGFVVGYGQKGGVTEGGPYVGTANISGGALTNGQGNTAIGVGLARGLVNVSGGAYVASNPDRANFIGLAGGVGAFVQSGGAVSLAGDVYVGGAGTNATYQGTKLVECGWDLTRHDATGSLIHSNGTFAVGGNLVLGADGQGAIDVVGAAGSFAIGGDLVFSNQVENAQSGGTLNFIFDESGITPVVVDGKAIFRTGAKMAVDVSAYTGSRGKWLIKAAGGLENPIAPEDVELTGATGDLKDVCLRCLPNGYRLSFQNGICVIVR